MGDVISDLATVTVTIGVALATIGVALATIGVGTTLLIVAGCPVVLFNGIGTIVVAVGAPVVPLGGGGAVIVTVGWTTQEVTEQTSRSAIVMSKNGYNIWLVFNVLSFLVRA